MRVAIYLYCSPTALACRGSVAGMVLLLLLCCWATPGHGQAAGFISFAQDRIIVDEGPSLTPVAIPLSRVGGTTGAVVISITVSQCIKICCGARPGLPLASCCYHIANLLLSLRASSMERFTHMITVTKIGYNSNHSSIFMLFCTSCDAMNTSIVVCYCSVWVGPALQC